MPTHRRERKGKRQRFYARNTLNTTFDDSVWAFDAFLFGPTGHLPLYDENPSGADQLFRRGPRHTDTAGCLCHDAGFDRPWLRRTLGAAARRHGDGAIGPGGLD